MNRDHRHLIDPINVLWYSPASKRRKGSNVDANEVWQRLADATLKVDDDALGQGDNEFIGGVGGVCNRYKRTAADGDPIAVKRSHIRLFYAFSFDRKGTFVVGDAHTDQCDEIAPAGNCLSCHYALPSNTETRTYILNTWKLLNRRTGWHHLENTAYVYQPCGASGKHPKHPKYVHGDGYEISLQTVPKR